MPVREVWRDRIDTPEGLSASFVEGAYHVNFVVKGDDDDDGGVPDTPIEMVCCPPGYDGCDCRADGGSACLAGYREDNPFIQGAVCVQGICEMDELTVRGGCEITFNDGDVGSTPGYSRTISFLKQFPEPADFRNGSYHGKLDHTVTPTTKLHIEMSCCPLGVIHCPCSYYNECYDPLRRDFSRYHVDKETGRGFDCLDGVCVLGEMDCVGAVERDPCNAGYESAAALPSVMHCDLGKCTCPKIGRFYRSCGGEDEIRSAAAKIHLGAGRDGFDLGDSCDFLTGAIQCIADKAKECAPAVLSTTCSDTFVSILQAIECGACDYDITDSSDNDSSDNDSSDIASSDSIFLSGTLLPLATLLFGMQ